MEPTLIKGEGWVSRYHDISAGHRVVGHENKCRGIHGHNYRIHFMCKADTLDDQGRIIDFSVIKSKLCQWLEDEWDHRMLLWDQDPLLQILFDTSATSEQAFDGLYSIVPVPFNPTAENMALYLLNEIGPVLMAGVGVVLDAIQIEETRKCSAIFRRNRRKGSD